MSGPCDLSLSSRGVAQRQTVYRWSMTLSERPDFRFKLKAVADGIVIEVPDGLGGCRAVYVARKPQDRLLHGREAGDDEP